MQFDDDEFVGEPPSATEVAEWDSVEHLIWAFRGVASPDCDPMFALRHALSLYFSWKPKLPVDGSDWGRVIDAVAVAKTAAAHRPPLYALQFVYVGLCAIIDTLKQREASRPPRQISIAQEQALRAEVSLYAALEMIRFHEPKAWLPAEYCTLESPLAEVA